jgi:hypothetical protein
MGYTLKKQEERVRLNSSGVGYGLVASSYGHVNQFWIPQKGVNFHH